MSKTIGLAFALMAVLGGVAAGMDMKLDKDWHWPGISYPIALHMQNSSFLYVSNVDSTEGWNISFFGVGTNVTVEPKKLNASWAIGINLTNGKVTPILPMNWFALNETYYFRDNGHPDLKAFKITDASGRTMLSTEFAVGGTVTGAENEPVSGSLVSNGAQTLFGSWVICQVNGSGVVINEKINVIGEYLVNGKPTGYASKDSSRPLEKTELRNQIAKLQARLEKI
jgi:hypothetical protein